LRESNLKEEFQRIGLEEGREEGRQQERKRFMEALADLNLSEEQMRKFKMLIEDDDLNILNS